MCGRYTLTVDAAVLAELFELEPLTELQPRYNIAPTQKVPIVRPGDGRAREWASVRWGLIPSWAKDPSIGARLINARAETAADKPSFRAAFKHRRCLVPADGFYEWVKLAGGKQPHHIRFADRRPFAFAGLWERWSAPDGDVVESCTILTTSPNELIARLHDRMPVIVPREGFAAWLAEGPLPAGAAAGLLAPHPAEGMEAVPATSRINSPRNDDPGCLTDA
ncbi:MAG: SOS response-associated peptidase [Thermoanaerobaculales bacterium]|jgi:putative SOS response-associated peptidase YedK|nr:SOS response-associated peptidase [Thermoanaerobaculales bacterium]